MKILFICGSLEPGRDGVGDYTRILAGELILQGHLAAAVALNDPYVPAEVDSTQTVDGIALPVLRMPSVMDIQHRFRRVKEWIERFQPGWVSLQFVPYAFHPKGLPVLLHKQLNTLLIPGRRAHIMFHETWVGVENRLNWKRWVTAAMQRMIIAQMIRSIRPKVIHTQLPKSHFDLEHIMPEVKKLPLFSNIELAEKSQEHRPGMLRVGFFSQAEASESIIAFLTSLAKNAKEKHIQLELLLIGGDQSRMKTVGNMLEKIENLENRVSCTGFLAPGEISQALQSCSLGITTVPRHALGKSGSVAAFLTHGIPVAAPVIHRFHDPTEIGFFSTEMRSAIMLEPDLTCLRYAKAAAVAARKEIQVPVIAKTFIAHLQQSCTNKRFKTIQTKF